MVREEVKPPRELADEHTLIAQRYAGALVGHPYRNQQQSTVTNVDRSRPWREPAIVADDCLFCVRLTDEEAVRRVEGFQHQIDIEATRTKRQHLREWLVSRSPDIPEPTSELGEDLLHFDSSLGRANLRRFCELFQDMPTEKRPSGWNTKPFPLVALPLRIKRKMCIEWNHLYLRWMAENGLQYDFEQHVFWHDVVAQPEPQPPAELEPWMGCGGAAPDQDCHS